MHQTFQARLDMTTPANPASDWHWLERYAADFGQCQRQLYAAKAAGRDAEKEKKMLMARFGMTSRQYNALRFELDGKIDSVRALLKLEKTSLMRDIKSLTRSVKVLNEKCLAIEHDTLRVSRKAFRRLTQDHYHKTQRLTRKTTRLGEVNRRLAARVPGICFGTRRLFRQQFHLQQAGFANHAEWKKAWLAARNHQVFSLGSADETAGNQSCQADVNQDGTLTLSLRLPHHLVVAGSPKHLVFPCVVFPYGHERIVGELLCNKTKALAYRFHRDTRGWRVFLSFDVEKEALVTLPSQYGTLGVDFNEDHLAWAETDRHGNVVDRGIAPLHLKHLSSGQREQVLSQAVGQLTALSLKKQKPLVIEDLDFQNKKATLRELGSARYARMLSGLMVAKYKAYVEAKCSRSGVELIKVDPAFTSVAGRVKDATRLGVSVHVASAGMIARKGQSLREKLGRSGTVSVPLNGTTVSLPLPARNRGEKTRVTWQAVSRQLARQCADILRARKTAPTSARKKLPAVCSVRMSRQ